MTKQWEEWMINGGGVEDGDAKLPANGDANCQQEGRWQSGSLGHTHLLLNRQPEMHGKRWASNGFFIRNYNNSKNYFYIWFLLH